VNGPLVLDREEHVFSGVSHSEYLVCRLMMVQCGGSLLDNASRRHSLFFEIGEAQAGQLFPIDPFPKRGHSPLAAV